MELSKRVRSMEPGKIKCVIWDLDETIWNGRILDGDSPELRPSISDVLRELDSRGIIHSIASTNQHNHAWQYLNNFGISEYFIAPQIHMGNKVDSIRMISEALNFSFSNIAFIDDDPMERDFVQSMLPEVMVMNETNYIELPQMLEFQPIYLSEEGSRRRQMLREEIKRDEEVQKFSSMEKFLHSCEVVFHGKLAREKDFIRLCELAHRTNRMNASGVRYGTDEIIAWSKKKEHYIVISYLKDKYGDYGVVAAALVKGIEDCAKVEALWISCRVGKKGLPGAFFSYLGNFAYKLGYSRLRVLYKATGANRLAAFHLGMYGFDSKTSDNKGTIEYLLPLPEKIKEFPTWITAKCDF
jgi:FkbH-like protein